MKCLFLAILLFGTVEIIAEVKKSCEERCSVRPTLFALEKNAEDFDRRIKSIKNYNSCLKGCNVPILSAKLIPFEQFLKIQDEVRNCEIQLPEVFKKSYLEKNLNSTYQTVESTKTHLTDIDQDQKVIATLERKKQICQDHLAGKFDQEIYQQQFSQLQSCHEDLKSLRLPKQQYKIFHEINFFIKNRIDKKAFMPNKGVDALNVARKLVDCRSEYDQLKVISSRGHINNSNRANIKENSNFPISPKAAKGLNRDQ